ncbi:TetR/AcrR family transcriptional regulator [Nocardia sp. NPDC088792]|uniref:TetR/AcrR family transcriptional regulator n=1 Tax=Nocardia sp. NPDC088792 TaxID=3364332 RepID=UPI00382431E8
MTREDRREQLLDVVLDIIDTDGTAAVSMDAVARRAGVTRPVVYGVFTDTDDLLRNSLNRESDRALAQLAGALPTPGTPPIPAFTALFDAYLHAVLAAPQRWRAAYMITDSNTKAFQKRVNRLRALLVHHFAEALRPALPPDADIELMASHLLAALWESGRLRLIHPGDYPHDRLLCSLENLVTALVTAVPGR